MGAEAMEKCSLLLCTTWLAQPALLYNQDYLHRHGTAHSDLGSPTSIINHKNALQTNLVGGGIFSIEGHYSQMAIACVS